MFTNKWYVCNNFVNRNQKVMVAGTFAGCFNATVACPIERIKCLLQVGFLSPNFMSVILTLTALWAKCR